MHNEAKVCLEKIIREIDVLVSSKGFETSNKRERVGKYFELRWIKEFGWKKDIIRLLYPAQYLICIDINLVVTLPLKSRLLEDETTINSMSLESFYFPQLFLGLRSDGFSKRTAKTINKFISWFEENCGDPEKCILAISDAESGCIAIGSKEHKEVVEYLVRIQDEGKKEIRTEFA